ncbi:unnamed protein product [Amoebophrya sp. A25]|nr:unnamed protein product [Amoebophrya sp. A25]|eukprot:GSA25T00004582001.1
MQLSRFGMWSTGLLREAGPAGSRRMIQNVDVEFIPLYKLLQLLCATLGGAAELEDTTCISSLSSSGTEK